MRHDLTLDGLVFRLRPVRLDDAPFIAGLRSDPRTAGRVHPTSTRVDDQVAWLDAYFERPGDWYWIVERDDATPEGTVGLYGVDEAASRAEWGRWILRAGSLAAPESALLLYRAAFEHVGLREVFCHTVAANRAVLSFHDRCGLERVGRIAGAFRFGGEPVDAVEHRLKRDRWPAVRSLLEVRAAQAGELVRRAG